MFASKHILSSAILWVGHGAREGEQPPPLVIASKISRIEFIEKWGLTPVLKPRQDQRPRRAGAEDPGDGRYMSPFIPCSIHPSGRPTQPLVLHVTRAAWTLAKTCLLPLVLFTQCQLIAHGLIPDVQYIKRLHTTPVVSSLNSCLSLSIARYMCFNFQPTIWRLRYAFSLRV